VAAARKGWKQWDELDENSEGISVVVVYMMCQLAGPLWPLIHLHWAMERLDTAGAMQDMLTYSESALFWDALLGAWQACRAPPAII
jgi:hypothetical protein